MDPMRFVYVAEDVRAALDSYPALANNYNNDHSKIFHGGLLNNQGSFNQLLDSIQANLNSDPRLHLLTKFNYKRLKPDPSSGLTFAEYFYEKSVGELIRALDGILSHSPYEI